MNIQQKFIQAGNYSPGRYGEAIKQIILHTEVGYQQSSWDRFNNPAQQASAHYLVGEDGVIIQAVADGDTAWHAGNWEVNKISIGIEHEDMTNYNDAVRTDAEYQASAELVADLCRRHGIPCQYVPGNNLESGIKIHKDVCIAGTACPDGLDWQRIIRQAQAILGGVQPAVVIAPIPTGVAVNPPAVDHVTVQYQNLQVRTGPSTSDAGNQANTPDGMLHAGNVFSITGVTVGQDPFGDGHNLWLRSVRGNFVWAGGTDYPNQLDKSSDQIVAPAPTPPAPAPEPTPVVAPAPEPAKPVDSLPASAGTNQPDATVPVTVTPPAQNAVDVITAPVPVPSEIKTEGLVTDLTTGLPVAKVPVGTLVTAAGHAVVGDVTYIVTQKMLDSGQKHGIDAKYFKDLPAVDTISPKSKRDVQNVEADIVVGGVTAGWQKVLKFLHILHNVGIKKNKGVK